MDRPVIPDKIDALCLRKRYGDLVDAVGELPHRNSRHVPGQDSATYRLHKGDDAHTGVGTMTVPYPRLSPSHAALAVFSLSKPRDTPGLADDKNLSRPEKAAPFLRVCLALPSKPAIEPPFFSVCRIRTMNDWLSSLIAVAKTSQRSPHTRFRHSH